MNYRHIFHTGNFADVFKHSLLISLIERLQIKEKPLTLIDAHAGIGLYNLQSVEVKRNPEYEQGILRLLQDSKPIDKYQRYLSLIKPFQSNETLTHYPGSPWLMRACLREQDELILNELHPQDYQTLRQTIPKQANIHIHQRDAYELLPGILPPRNGRAIILIDPPFEKADEYQQIATLMPKLEARFANGCYLIWYPIKNPAPHRAIQAIVRSTSMPNIRFMLKRETSSIDTALLGCGVVLFNPPWGIEEIWNEITNKLERIFKV